MGNGSSKLNVTHTLAANLFGGYLYAALLTNLTLETNSLILTAVTFPILRRAKDLLAEKTVCLSLKGTVIDCFSLSYLSV